MAAQETEAALEVGSGVQHTHSADALGVEVERDLCARKVLGSADELEGEV